MTSLPTTIDATRSGLPSKEGEAQELAQRLTQAVIADEADAEPLAIKNRAQQAMLRCDELKWRDARNDFAFLAVCCEWRWEKDNPRRPHGGAREEQVAQRNLLPAHTATRIHDAYEGTTEEDLHEAKRKADEAGVPVTRAAVVAEARGLERVATRAISQRYIRTRRIMHSIQQDDPTDVSDVHDYELEDIHAMNGMIADHALAVRRLIGGRMTPVESHETAQDDTQTALTITDEAQQAVDLYNEMAERAGLPRAQKLTAQRKSKLKRRLHDCGGIEGWKTALAKVEASPHCTGDNDRGWTANLDFMLQESSFTKIMEGHYDDRRRSRSQSQAERVARQMEDMGL